MFASLLFRSHLNPGEKILYLAHAHPLTVYKGFLKRGFYGLALPGLFYIMLPPFIVVWLVWTGFGVLSLIAFFLDWYFDALLVTSTSLIDVQWDGIFTRSSTRIEYHTIDGISYEKAGFWALVFNYGDIAIERIGGGKPVGIKKVSFPKTVEREVLEAKSEFMRSKNLRDHNTLKDLISNMVQDYSRQ